MIIYISKQQALETHRKTVEYSGGGSYSAINDGYLESALELIQNDDYYPTFEDKLVHLIWSINRNHAFSDGNKRLSITLGVQFLSMNGFLFCIKRFLNEMENISYWHDLFGTFAFTFRFHGGNIHCFIINNQR